VDTVWGQMAISAYLRLFMKYYFKAGLAITYFQLRFGVFDMLRRRGIRISEAEDRTDSARTRVKPVAIWRATGEL